MLNHYFRKSQILLGVLLSIWVASAIQPYEALDDHGGHGECALLLEGPGRSSAFDYGLNTLRGTPSSYGGPQTCITYDAVNNAYIQARKYVRVAERRERYEHEELATVGELILEVSRILARTYGLSTDEIEHGLPLIDTSKTLVREICPAFLSNVHCQPGKYRRYDGLCNNLNHPSWGSVQTTFARLLKPVYADSVSDPRIGTHGATLPPPRIVSRTIHPDEGYHDHAATILLISWGQFMDHDLTLTATPLDPVTRNEPEECCHRPPNSKNPYCLEIGIPHDDPFYGVYGVRCIDFVRGFPGVRAGCRLGSRNQFNILTAIIDGNTVYGVEENFARSLRTGYGGLLRMNPVFAQYGLHDLLPLKLDIPDEGCTRPNRSMYCFDAGEIRVNEQLVLTCMHTLMAREHNRVAHKLGEINPHWDDETVYQESRRVVIAEIQHITYNEFLPLVLGKEVMAKFGLLLQKEGYWNGYDPNVNPGVLASFSAAAFRFGHSLLPTNVERWSKAHKFIASRRLRDLIRQPFDLYRAGVIDEYFMGMSNQVAQAMDDSVTQEVTNHLFRKIGQPFGVDLAAFNMQRGREFGLPSYMEYRKYCGLPGAEGWDDLFGSMNNITVKRYAQIYVHPQDIDLWSGGVSERPLPGAMVGPTFACIIATQFSNARRGDRFWYELGGLPHSFTHEQLSELRKARLARIVCDNTDIIDTIQLYPMVLPDHEINPRVPCRSGVLLNIDLSKWADYGGGGQYSHQAPVHQDSASLDGYVNDPSVGKYVNQDGLQQLRHYLKVGPYREKNIGHHQAGNDGNPFFGYLRQVILPKWKRNVNVVDDDSSLVDVAAPSPSLSPLDQRLVSLNNQSAQAILQTPAPPSSPKPQASASFTSSVVTKEYIKLTGQSNQSLASQPTVLGCNYGRRATGGSGSISFLPVLTRRPVHVIHNSKGHDPSNIANVHYSPHPEHEELPAPGVDHSPRGYPIHPPALGKVVAKPVEEVYTTYDEPAQVVAPVSDPVYGPPLKTSGVKGFSANLGIRINLGSGGSGYGPPGGALGVPIGVAELHSQDAYSPEPPQVHVPVKVEKPGTQYGRQYGAPTLPFGSGPLALHYGFKPVSTPYGNVSHGQSEKQRYGQAIPQYVVDELQAVYSKNNHYKRSPTDEVSAGKSGLDADSKRAKRHVPSDTTLTIDSTSNPDAVNNSFLENTTRSAVDEAIGLRASVVNAALDLMTVLTDMSVELLHRVRHTADYVLPSAMFSYPPQNLTEASDGNVRINLANSSLNNLDSEISSKTELSSSQPLDATPPEAAESTKPGTTATLRKGPLPQVLDPRKVLVSRAASFVRTVLEDVNRNRGIPQRAQG